MSELTDRATLTELMREVNPGVTIGEIFDRQAARIVELELLLLKRGGHLNCPSSVGRDCYCGWEEFVRDGNTKHLKPRLPRNISHDK